MIFSYLVTTITLYPGTLPPRPIYPPYPCFQPLPSFFIIIRIIFASPNSFFCILAFLDIFPEDHAMNEKEMAFRGTPCLRRTPCTSTPAILPPIRRLHQPTCLHLYSIRNLRIGLPFLHSYFEKRPGPPYLQLLEGS